MNIFCACQIDLESTNTAPVQYFIGELMGDSSVFLNFVIGLVQSGFLRPYDIFVGDNAKIHAHGDCKELADALWESLRILWLPLPPYSPEFNPTEEIFHITVERSKIEGPRILQQDNTGIVDVAAEVLNGITRDEVVKCYRDCGYVAY